ncbi:MAG: GldG family protein [Verrucomicrobiales bacterium]|nr:GldG family protein [Verrucomicrobiales bacterium]
MAKQRKSRKTPRRAEAVAEAVAEAAAEGGQAASSGVEAGTAVRASGEGPVMPGRWRIGLHVVLQLTLWILFLGGINYLAYRYYWRVDLTEGGVRTLSEVTRNYLGKLPKAVEITLLIPRNAPEFDETHGLLEEYRRHGGKKVKLDEVDPVRDIERAEQLKAETGLVLEQPGVLLRAGEAMRFVRQDELLIRDPARDGAVAGYRIEDAVTSALIGLMEGKVRRLYVLVGKGNRDPRALEETMETLAELSRQQSFELQTLNLTAVEAIPEDAAGLLLVGLRYDLSARETQMVDVYWKAERAGLFILLDPGAHTPRLDAWLTENGVRPRGDRVLMAESTSAGPKKEFTVEAGFSAAFPATRSLADALTMLAGQTESLDIEAATPAQAAALKARGIQVAPLVQATERFWGERDYLAALPVADEADGDALGPVVLAAAVERGVVADERLRVESSRMVVVGNAELLRPSTMLVEARDFAAGCLNWMISRERLLGIPARPARAYRVQLNANQRRLLFGLTTFALPGLALGMGLLVWASRRGA